MTLLAPSTLPIVAKETKKDDDKDEDEFKVKEDTSISISDNALLPGVVALGSSENGVGGGDFSFDQVSFYEVRSGDTLREIAEMFDVTEDTILAANDMKKGDKLKAGDFLLILPFSGIEHTVVKGETLLGIANKYKVGSKEIIAANDLEDANSSLSIGMKLMIPNASIPTQTPKAPVKKSTSSSAKNTTSSKTVSTTSSGSLIHPLPNSHRVRGVGGNHKGVDFGAPIGTPIYASASGTVLIAQSGFNGGFGTYVVVQHANGTKTLYAHMSRLGTSKNDKVSQGEVIGYVGSTGRSTGPHLHYEVLGGKNPF